MVTGIILAGGKSSRFGEDKGLFSFKGKKLIEYSIETLSAVCDEIIISTNDPVSYRFTGLKTVKDLYRNIGPLSGIHAGLKNSSTSLNLFTGCDMPFLPAELFAKLLENSKNYHVVIPIHKNLTETMATFFHRHSLPVIEKAIKAKRYKILDAIKPLETLYLNVENFEFYDEKIFFNINSKEDLS